MLLASDFRNNNFSGSYNPDSLLQVRFYVKKIKNEYESKLQGKEVLEDFNFVEITTPGNSLNIVDTFVREEHKKRFPQQWKMFQDSLEDSSDIKNNPQILGTSVRDWKDITPELAEELIGLKFYTVEQIANASDLQLQKLGMMAPQLRIKSKQFLSNNMAKENAQVSLEIEKRDNEINNLKDELNSLKEAFNKMLHSATDSTTVNKAVKRKYTKKVVETKKDENDAESQVVSSPVKVEIVDTA